MDDLLRTYARKRREDAGEPQGMHPATRRLLQAEAAKLRPREAAPQLTPWSWLLARWPRVAFAVGVFAVLTVVVWNWIPDRGQSSSPLVMAKQEEKDKEVSQPSTPSRDELAPAKSQAGNRPEQDKDFAARLKAEAKAPAARPLDEVQLSDSARAADAQADMKLKKDSTIRGMNRQPAPTDGLQLAEAGGLAATRESEKQTVARKLDAGTTPTRFAAGQAASRSEPLALTAPPAGANLAQKPSADASGTKVGVTYSAPGAPAAAEPSLRLPIVTQANPVTDAVPSSGLPGGLGRGAERQVTTFNQITVPAPPSSSTSAVLAFDTRVDQTKGGRDNFGVAKGNNTGAVSVGDLASIRARATGAGGVLIAGEKNQPQSLYKQVYRFQRQVEPEKPAAAKAKVVKAPAPASVLLTFDFEQDGDSVRVTDSDGSVYAGRFVTDAEIGRARFAEIGEGLNSPDAAGAEKRLELNTASGARNFYSKAGSGFSTTNRIFRANGTNRTYGQLVTIEALLSGESRAATLAGTTTPPSVRPPGEPTPKTAGAAPLSATAAASEALKAERLVGRMRIGASEEVKLIAVPVAK